MKLIHSSKFILIFLFLFYGATCNNNQTIPLSFQYVGEVELVYANDNYMLLDYKRDSYNHQLTIGDTVYIISHSHKIPFLVTSINTWAKCVLNNNNSSISDISEGMSAYFDLHDLYNKSTSQNSNNSFKNKNKAILEYSTNMKNIIKQNWFPPPIVNSNISNYTPGYTRIMRIPPQEVKLNIILNRYGDVVKVEIIESKGYTYLDKSCVDAIKLSKCFGPVPDTFKGEQITIPFVFGYGYED